MCDPVSATVATIGLFGGAQIYASEKAASAQKEAMEEGKKQAARQEELAMQNLRASSKRRARASDVLYGGDSGKTGQGSASITGPQGVDPSNLTLGKTSLLGS